MHETVEQLIEYTRGLWRFRWFAMIVSWLIVILGWAVLTRIPIVYTATAQIRVDTKSVLQPLLKGLAFERDVDEYLGLMSRQIISRPNLEQVAHMVGLDSTAVTPQQREASINKLSQEIVLNTAKTRESAKERDLYTISYANVDPKIALGVVQALIDTLTIKTLAETRQDAATAHQFLTQQIKEYETKLTASEDRVREFKRQHINDLPEQGGSYFERLKAAQSIVDEVELQIREAESRQHELERQLQGTASVQRALAADGTPILTPTESRLLALQKKLDELLLGYTDAHPDVVATRRSIADLEKERERELKALAAGASSNASIANPLHQQLRLALGQVESELAALRAKRDTFRGRIQTLQSQLQTLPGVEAEMQRLDRDYELNKQQYATLVARLESLKLTDDVEQTGEDVKIRLVDPPRASTSENKRQRLIFTTGVLAAGIGGGLAIAFLLSQIRPAIYRRRALINMTELPVFGVVSQIWTPRMRLLRGVDVTTYALAGLIMVALYGGLVFLQMKDIHITQLTDIQTVLHRLGATQ